MDVAATWEPIDSLTPHPKNPRHNDGAVDEVAASIRTFGFGSPIIARTADRVIIAGHTRWKAAEKLGMDKVPVRFMDLDPARAAALMLADNKLGELAEWDDALLAELAAEHDLDLTMLGWSDEEAAGLLGGGEEVKEETEEPPAPDDGPPDSQPGMVYELGPHRLACGDSTKAETWAALMGDEQAMLCHADPPYGMGKEADGVENDNLYREQLDSFQMSWWRAVRPNLDNRASVYIWGNAESLWRLWFTGGLAESERLTMRNEIVWDKGSAPGMASEANNQYVTASERCLFFQLGAQFMGNINAADFPEQWAPLLDRLAQEAHLAGLTPADVKRVCGVGMYGHWFTRSQFTLIPRTHYDRLAREFPGRFSTPWSELHAEWINVRGRGREVVNGKLVGMRSYFDNAHEVMRDVWQYPRVSGDERHGHATPKPVSMIVRCITSSCPPQGIVIEPFGGSGTTLVAAAMSGRVCRTAEISPSYCDVIRRRWTRWARENGRDPGPGALEPRDG